MNTLPTFRASEMARTLACPGSALLTARVARSDRDDGHEGSLLHWMIADQLIRLHGAIPPEGGLDTPRVPKGYTLPRNSEWMADWAIRHVLETIPENWSLMVEQESIHDFGRWRLSAHRDITAQSPCGTKVKAIDWKTGMIPVEPADENDQVLTYEVSIKLDWPDVQEIEFEICQPRLPFEERISCSIIVGAEIDACVQSLDARVCASLDDQLALNSGKKQCAWCVGISCPALRADLNDMKMKLTPELLASIEAEPNDGLLADFVITARTLKRPIDDATEMLHERLDKCGQIVSDSGHTVSRKIQRGDYDVPDPVAFLQLVRTDLPADEELAGVVSVSMTKLKDSLSRVFGIKKTGKGDSAETRFDEKYRPHVVQGEKRILVIS